MPSFGFASNDSEEISLAIALSQVQAEEDERLRKQEEEELERVLRLSLEEKWEIFLQHLIQKILCIYKQKTINCGEFEMIQFNDWSLLVRQFSFSIS